MCLEATFHVQVLDEYKYTVIEVIEASAHVKVPNLFPNDKDSCKLKEFADDNFQFDESDRKFSKRVENTVGKGEIAHYEQFLLFPQCFQKTCTADT